MNQNEGRKRSLRRVMLFSAVAFGAIVIASVLTLVSLSNTIRTRLDGNTDQLNIEEGSRLKAEAIKEAQQNFEIAAQRAIDLFSSGDSATARARIDMLSRRATVLEQTVREFVADREHQRLLARGEYEAALRRLQQATAIVVIALGLTAILLADLIRRRVMLPLDDSIRESDEEVRARNRELTRTLDELQRAHQELVQHEKLRAMGEMLAGLAHELNNPLAGILGIAECVKMELAESDDPKSRELGVSMVEPLVTESLRARDLVRNLLHFARQSTERTERVHLSGAVDVAVGLRRHVFAQAEKTIELDVPADLYVIAQAQKLQHAIINIANNALDALCEGDGTRLHITAKRDGTSVLLIFEDEGSGFRQPDRAFDPFYTTKPIGAGTGLGLALVHRFVQEFGGTVSADNAPSGGARVMMRLQASPAATVEPSANVSSPRS